MSRLSKAEQIAFVNTIFGQFNKNLSRMIITDGNCTGTLSDFPADMQQTIAAWRNRWAEYEFKNWGKDWKTAFVILDGNTTIKMPVASTAKYPYALIDNEDIDYIRNHWKLFIMICRLIEIAWAQLDSNIDSDFQNIQADLNLGALKPNTSFQTGTVKLNLREGIIAFRDILNILSKQSVEKLIDGIKKQKDFDQHFMMHYWMDGFSQRFQRQAYVLPIGSLWRAQELDSNDKKIENELYWSIIQDLFLERYSWNQLFHPFIYDLLHFINILSPSGIPWLTAYFDPRNFTEIRKSDKKANDPPDAVWQFHRFYRKIKQYDFKTLLSVCNRLPAWVVTTHSWDNQFSEMQDTILTQTKEIFDYSEFQLNILLFVICFKSQFLSTFNDFFLQLENDSDRKIISSVASDVLLNEQSMQKLPLWCVLAKQLREEYGIEIVEQISILKADLTDFIKISELFLDLVDYFNLQLLNREQKSISVQSHFRSPTDIFSKHKTATEIIACLKALQIQYWEQRFPEKSVETLKKDFLTQTETVQSPLSRDEFEPLLAECEKIDSLYKEYFGMSSITLGQCAKALGKNVPLSGNDEIHLFAIIREVIRQKFKILPRKTQILAVLGMIHHPKQIKGCIAQMKTGEGKSTVITLLAAFLGCQGRFVDIITSNHSLAIRDKEKYAEFYALFGITCSHICNRNQTAEDFNGQILYAINTDVEFSLLWNELQYYDIRYTVIDGKKMLRPFDVVVVDEVDVMFIENARNSAQIADDSTVDVSWVYQPFLAVKQSMGDENFLALNPEELRRILITHQNGHYAPQTADFMDQQLKDWRNNAVEAQKKIEGADYIVQSGSLEDSTDASQRHIVIMEKNTGHLSKGTQWPGGLHQFIEIKHGIPPSRECNTIAAISHPVFFNKYKKIYGLTGTMGGSVERTEIENIYGVVIFYVPTHSPVLREKKPDQIVLTIKEQTQKIIQSIQFYHARDRPVLILFETINQTKEFSAALIKVGIRHLVLNEQQREKEDFVIARAGEAGAVTVATNMAGRGTDIVLLSRAKAAGGLHVIFAFYPQNLRIEEQGFGRAGRQGQPGSGEMILSLEDKMIHQLLREHEPQAILFMLFGGNFISFLHELRTQSILEASRDRQSVSEKEVVLFTYLNRFFDALKVIAKQLTSLDTKHFQKILNNAQPLSDQNQFLMIPDHPVFIAAKRKMQSSGLTVSVSTIDYLRNAYLTLLRNRWARWYTQVSHHECGQLSIEQYKNNLQEKFDALCRKGFTYVCEKPLESFYDRFLQLTLNKDAHVDRNKSGSPTLFTIPRESANDKRELILENDSSAGI